MKILQKLSALIALIMLMSGCSNYYDGPVSDHFDGERFFLPGSERERSFFEFLKWRFTRAPGVWPETVENRYDPTPPKRVEGAALKVWSVGHASVLIQTQGLNILTDPVFSERVSPFSWMGPKRVRAPGIRWENLPPIDVVLVSHNHYDHLDTATLKRLWDRDQPRIVAPLGNDTVIRSDYADVAVETLDWGDTLKITDAVTLHLEPLQHWSARGVFDTNKALWGAFVIEAPDGPVYFAGDTGYDDGAVFRAAQAKYGAFRLAILPIGAYLPRWFMTYAHMNPIEALRAFKDLNAANALAHHIGTFPLADDAFDDPLKDLESARGTVGFATETFRTLDTGEGWDIP